MRNLIIITGILILCGCKNSNHLSDAYGNFEAKEIIVSSEVNGKVLSFNIEKGQIVKKGELVGIIDSVQISLKKKQLAAQLGVLNSNYQYLKMQTEVQEEQYKSLIRERDRLDNLYKDGAATLKQLDDITSQISILDKQIQATKTQFSLINSEKESVYVQIAQLDDQLKNCLIRNPISGTILEKYIEESELATVGKNLYKVSDLGVMDLKVYVSGSQLSNIKIGQNVDVYFDEDKKKNNKTEGTISWISSTAEFTPKIIQTKEERVKLVYAVIVKVRNDGSLKIGMPGEVVFN